MAARKASKNSKIETDVIDLGIITHVVPRNFRQDRELRMLRPRNAHAQSKKKEQKRRLELPPLDLRVVLLPTGLPALVVYLR